MDTCFYAALEKPIEGHDPGVGSGKALARVVGSHPVLMPLLDFVSVNPIEIARQVGMVYPYEEDGDEDLNEIDFGPAEWFEPPVGLAAVQRALDAVRDHPESLAEAIYDPELRAEEVIADLEAIRQTLLLAQQYETRFHFRQENKQRLPNGPP